MNYLDATASYSNCQLLFMLWLSCMKNWSRQNISSVKEQSDRSSCNEVHVNKTLPSSVLQKLSGGNIVSGSIPCCKGRTKATQLLLQKENVSLDEFPTISPNS